MKDNSNTSRKPLTLVKMALVSPLPFVVGLLRECFEMLRCTTDGTGGISLRFLGTMLVFQRVENRFFEMDSTVSFEYTTSCSRHGGIDSFDQSLLDSRSQVQLQSMQASINDMLRAFLASWHHNPTDKDLENLKTPPQSRKLPRGEQDPPPLSKISTDSSNTVASPEDMIVEGVGAE
jgi:hypothetical protein